MNGGKQVELNEMIISTDSNASGIIEGFTDQDGETYASVEVDTSSDFGDVAPDVGFQIELFLVLGIIIGILLIGDRRF